MTKGSVDLSQPRFASPICTIGEVARLVDMPVTTVQSWAGQRTSRPQLITKIRAERRGWPSVPLVGLAEAATLRGMLALLPRPEVMAAAAWIQDHYEQPHPLANKRLVTDGVYAFVEEHHDQLYRLVGGQIAIRDSIEAHLRPIDFADDYYPLAFHVGMLPGVVIDPLFNAGRMCFARNKVPLFAVTGSLLAGATSEEIISEYRLELDEVHLVERELPWLASAA